MDSININILDCDGNIVDNIFQNLKVKEVRENVSENVIRCIYLTHHKSNLMEDGEMKPSYITEYKSGNMEMCYRIPRGKSWSMGGFFAKVRTKENE